MGLPLLVIPLLVIFLVWLYLRRRGGLATLTRGEAEIRRGYALLMIAVLVVSAANVFVGCCVLGTIWAVTVSAIAFTLVLLTASLALFTTRSFSRAVKALASLILQLLMVGGSIFCICLIQPSLQRISRERADDLVKSLHEFKRSSGHYPEVLAALPQKIPQPAFLGGRFEYHLLANGDCKLEYSDTIQTCTRKCSELE